MRALEDNAIHAKGSQILFLRVLDPAETFVYLTKEKHHQNLEVCSIKQSIMEPEHGSENV